MRNSIKLGKLLSFIIIFTTISCQEETETKVDFIKKFQSDLENKHIDNIAEYTSFPLQNGEYLADQMVDEVFFKDNFTVIFDSTATNILLKANIEQFKDVQNTQFKNYTDLFRFVVNYKYQETETTVFYIFGKKDNKIKFIGIDMAG